LVVRPLVRSLTGVIGNLTARSDTLVGISEQITNSSQRLADSASEQASSLEETSSAMEQMAAMTRANAEHAQQASSLASKAQQAAAGGDQTMLRLNQAMTAINESAGRISKIIKVIEEIAFQTNLLALNAAVEAARAGEQGRGFAVVATEVRNLAQRAAEAARETTGLIEDAVGRSQEGAQVATEAGQSLGAIVTDVTRVSELIGGIAKASEEQAEGVEQVNSAITQMNKATQENAAEAGESSSVAEQLGDQAQTVKGMVDELVKIVSGASGCRQRGLKTRGDSVEVPGACVGAEARRPKPTRAPQAPAGPSDSTEF
jgi:methyl-accepting chemotaxis protein